MLRARDCWRYQRSRFVEYRHDRGIDARNIGEVGRHNHDVVGLGEVAECGDMELCNLEVFCLQPAFFAERNGDRSYRCRSRSS